MKRIVVAIVIMTITALAASAKSNKVRTPAINRVQIFQQLRIAHGLHRGKLTAMEAAHLQALQAHIKYSQVMAKKDGKISYRERRQIRMAQRSASASIYIYKHNNQHR